jgi:hypothetical protein
MPESPEALPEIEERLRVNMPIITNGSLSRVPVCGATDRLVEKDPGRGDRILRLNVIARQKCSGNINNEDKR